MSQSTEVFSGNIYITIPSFLDEKCSFKHFCKTKVSQDSGNTPLLVELTKRFNNEISSEVHQSLERFHLGEYELACYDQFECSEENGFYKRANIYVSLHSKTCLGVVTIEFHNEKLAVSQLLDRVSQDNILVRHDDHSIQLLKDLLAEKFLIKVFSTAAKVCLSTRNAIHKDVLPYYLANETFNSNDMQAQIISSELQHKTLNNVAQYNSSDLFVGRHSVLRIDKRKGNNQYPELQSDSTFIFIIEALLFKEAAVLRTNQQVLRAISKAELLSLKTMEKVTSNFAVTMPFWDIRIFKYITAQHLANHLEKSFGIDKHFDLYEKNQQFLQHKINIRQGIEEDSKNKVLYLIAIVLFIFEISPYLFNLFSRVLGDKGLKSIEILAVLGAGTTTGLITLIIVLIIKRRSIKHG